MAYSDLLRRLEAEAGRVTSVTRSNPAEVTGKKPENQSGNLGNPGNLGKARGAGDSGERESRENPAISDHSPDNRAFWYVAVEGRVFPMIRPGGMSREQAERAARARWPDAEIIDRGNAGGG